MKNVCQSQLQSPDIFFVIRCACFSSVSKVCLFIGLVLLSINGHSAPSFITFETGQVRPLALSKDGLQLYVANTPDNRLEVFDVTDQGLEFSNSIPVGMEPVAIAVRNSQEVWVVNHLSDSISVVDTSTSPGRVVRTLLVGDEPRDIVFSRNDRAFITTARRGQHRTHASIADVPGAGDPLLTTEGIPRADIWVFDANNLGDEIGGKPIKIMELFGDTPRALAVSPDGNTVYAAIMFSGNQTASISEGTLCEHGEASCLIRGQLSPGDIVGPKQNAAGDRAPLTGIIVKQDQQQSKFFDQIGRDWTNLVKFTLPDKDVFAIDSTTLNEVAVYQNVGTTLFNLAVNPINGSIYVSNFEANNFGLFEGPGIFGNSTVQGHLSEARITVINDNGVQPRHLNKHIDYSVLPAPAGTKENSLSKPLEMVVSSNGQMLAVAAFGSSKVGIFDTEALENDTFDPRSNSANYISVSGGGPSGLVLDEAQNKLYVLTRFDNSVSVIDMDTKVEVQHLAMHNPEPESVIVGRPFLYDSNLTSSNGEASCASCHIFGDNDQLAWNLGNPDDEVTKNPYRIFLGIANTGLGELFDFFLENLNGTGETDDFHSMKGPMTTQTLRGTINHGAMHWRGDRATGFFGTDRRRQPPFDSELSFNNFIVAFEGLNGRDGMLAEADMQLFTDFAMQITLPPNPIRALNNSLSRAEARGRKYFLGCDGPGAILCGTNGFPILGEHRADGIAVIPQLGFTCEGCHVLDPKKGFFGTDGKMVFDFVNQIIKVPQLRNVYTKVGRFGAPLTRSVNPKDNEFKGDQIRGFGVFHDGGLDTVTRFMNGEIFNADQADLVGFVGGDPQRRDIEAYMFAFDSDLPPIVGQQITLFDNGSELINQRIDLFIESAEKKFFSKVLGGKARECELVVKGIVDGEQRGWLYNRKRNRFESDRSGDDWLRDSELRALANVVGQELTYTCAPYGSGKRMAIDRDLNNILDSDFH